MKRFLNKRSSINKLAKRLRSPSISLTIDLLVIVSLILNAYSLYQSSRMDGALDRMDTMLNTMNGTLQKTTEDLTAHMENTYPDILAAHMAAANGTPMDPNDNSKCTQP